ncbi:unnamed protein product [Orchesella dallaii]|uniref:Uncharacterized protein n=1 Tax=Orchesella dallaii TaxID=48710 RepID=A0ABP1R0D6_9HEXA
MGLSLSSYPSIITTVRRGKVTMEATPNTPLTSTPIKEEAVTFDINISPIKAMPDIVLSAETGPMDIEISPIETMPDIVLSSEVYPVEAKFSPIEYVPDSFNMGFYTPRKLVVDETPRSDSGTDEEDDEEPYYGPDFLRHEPSITRLTILKRKQVLEEKLLTIDHSKRHPNCPGFKVVFKPAKCNSMYHRDNVLALDRQAPVGSPFFDSERAAPYTKICDHTACDPHAELQYLLVKVLNMDGHLGVIPEDDGQELPWSVNRRAHNVARYVIKQINLYDPAIHSKSQIIANYLRSVQKMPYINDVSSCHNRHDNEAESYIKCCGWSTTLHYHFEATGSEDFHKHIIRGIPKDYRLAANHLIWNPLLDPLADEIEPELTSFRDYDIILSWQVSHSGIPFCDTPLAFYNCSSSKFVELIEQKMPKRSRLEIEQKNETHEMALYYFTVANTFNKEEVPPIMRVPKFEKSEDNPFKVRYNKFTPSDEREPPTWCFIKRISSIPMLSRKLFSFEQSDLKGVIMGLWKTIVLSTNNSKRLEMEIAVLKKNLEFRAMLSTFPVRDDFGLKPFCEESKLDCELDTMDLGDADILTQFENPSSVQFSYEFFHKHTSYITMTRDKKGTQDSFTFDMDEALLLIESLVSLHSKVFYSTKLIDTVNILGPLTKLAQIHRRKMEETCDAFDELEISNKRKAMS